MKNTDVLHEFIEKIEDLAVMKTVMMQAIHSLKNGGKPPLVPALNDSVMTDVLTGIFEQAFKKAPDNSAKESKITIRGPQNWVKAEDGYQFYSGTEGEPYLDLVSYDGCLYMCKKSHRKIKDNYPMSSLDMLNGYWEFFSKTENFSKGELRRLGAPIAETNKNESDHDFKPLVK